MRISGKKKSVAMFATLLLCFCSALCIGIGALFHAKADSAQTLTPLYCFNFSDSENRGANTGSLNTVSATINGSAQYTTDAPKNRTALNITSAGTRQNYVSIAADAFNRESVTLAGWFKISQNMPAWSRMLTVNNQKKDTAQYSYMDVMPYGPGYANGLHINTAINNTALIGINGESDNMMLEGNEPDAGTAMPKANYTLPVYDAWTHYAYVLTPQSFKLYQNGVLLKTREGNFTASQFYSDSALITLGATLHDGTVDFTGAFADFRVYDGALTGEQLVSEFNIDYTDLLTTKFDFESSSISGTTVTDSVRGFTGTLMGNAQAQQDADRNSSVLSLDGSGEGASRTSFKIANKTLHGHNALTLSMDVYLAHDTPAYTRLFEFARTGSTALMLGANWGGTPLYIKSTLNNNNASKTSDYSIQGSYYDRWINITVTLDGSCEGRQNAVVYIDGVPVMQENNFIYKNTLFYSDDEWMDLSFGKTAYWGDAPMKGKIDNIKIWQTVLTQKQVLTETGVITIQDDQKAVNSEKEKLTVTYSDGDPSIELPTAVGEAVTVSWKSSHPAIVSATGEIIALPSDKDTVVTLTATLSRFGATATKTFDVTIKKEVASLLRAGTALENVTFPKGSYYYRLMETNLDFMMGLDKDRLLYNYRRIAGLDTKGVQSYGGTWISPESNGAGQFEAHYVTALAKASRTMPDYRYHGESVTDRLTYMVTEMKKCRDAFAAKYPNESGYFGAITTENFDVLTENRVDLSDGTQAWVPWYFNHKNMEAMLDVYWYAPTQELRNIGKDILSGLADWSYAKMNPLTEAKRNEVLKFREYGGMAEVLWQTYAVTGKEEHRKAATYFEEKDFLDKIYNNQDALKGLHANTTIPKFLGCAAAYEVTGKEYYKTICVNAYNMIMKRTYANGGTGDQEWWYTDAENTPESYESAETCCSYNMLKLADYLYRWTGDKTYADYFENTYTNHILASMAPDTGLKTYLTNTEFGYYKIYHTVDKSFWCCSCTGMESFAKLPYGIYYTDITESAAAPVVRVNMFYPSEYKVSDTITVTQSGNFYADQKTLFTVKGSGQFTLALRLPDWANGNITIKINGAVQSVTATNGYYEINRNWSDGDTVEYSVPFSFRLVALKGSENKNAIFYGPLLFVADLGDDDVHDVQESQVNFGKPYTGDIGNKIVFEEDWQNNTQVVADADGNISFVLHTRNQGDITFRPFNQVFHSRYGMYFEIYDTVADAEYDYTVNGNELGSAFDSENSITHFDVSYSATGTATVENGKLITPKLIESKLMAKADISGAFVVECTFAPYSAGASLDAGIYLFGTNVTGNQSVNITAYNVQIERNKNSASYVLCLYQYNNGTVKTLYSVALPMPANEQILLHIFVAENGEVKVYVGESRNPVIRFIDADGKVTVYESSHSTKDSNQLDAGILSGSANGRVGMRVNGRASMDDFRVISTGIEVGKNTLGDLIEVADALKAVDYTTETFADLTSALADAKTANENGSATQAEVNNAANALREAIAKLEKSMRAQLADLVAEVNGLDQSEYTAESFESVTIALEQIPNDLSELTEEQIETYYSALQTAVQALETKDADTPLTAAIESAEAIDLTEYEDAGKEAFTAALVKAKAAKESGSISEKEAATAELKEAMNALVKKQPVVPDGDAEATAALTAAIESAEAIDLAEYEDAGKEAFTAALAKARAAKASGSVSEKEAATAELNEAMSALVKKAPPQNNDDWKIALIVVGASIAVVAVVAVAVIMIRKKKSSKSDNREDK